MYRPLVKICGITNFNDALFCLDCGADFLGFIFYNKSPRYVEPVKVKKIIQECRECAEDYSFKSVGVFVNPAKELVDQIIGITEIDILQFHGDESFDFIGSFQKPKIKVFRISNKPDLNKCDEFSGADYFLFDSYSKGSYGGTGNTFNWDLIEDFEHKEKLFLSGGLNKDNIKAAVRSIRPMAVDLSSSLEKKPGLKDKKKVEEFFSIVNNM